MADQMNKNQGSDFNRKESGSKSMPSQDLDKSQRSTGGQRESERSGSTGDQQQRNQKANQSGSQQDIDE